MPAINFTRFPTACVFTSGSQTHCFRKWYSIHILQKFSTALLEMPLTFQTFISAPKSLFSIPVFPDNCFKHDLCDGIRLIKGCRGRPYVPFTADGLVEWTPNLVPRCQKSLNLACHIWLDEWCGGDNYKDYVLISFFTLFIKFAFSFVLVNGSLGESLLEKWVNKAFREEYS